MVTIFKWIKHEKEEKKTKRENVGNFRKLAKIFAGVAKFKKKISQSPASEFYTKFQSTITFSSELQFACSWTLRKDL